MVPHIDGQASGLGCNSDERGHMSRVIWLMCARITEVGKRGETVQNVTLCVAPKLIKRRK